MWSCFLIWTYCAVLGGIPISSEQFGEDTNVRTAERYNDGFVYRNKTEHKGEFLVIIDSPDQIIDRKVKYSENSNVTTDESASTETSISLISNGSVEVKHASLNEELRELKENNSSFGNMSNDIVYADPKNMPAAQENNVTEFTGTTEKPKSETMKSWLSESVTFRTKISMENASLPTTVKIFTVKSNVTNAEKLYFKKVQKNKGHKKSKQFDPSSSTKRQRKLQRKLLTRKLSHDPSFNSPQVNESLFDYKNMMVDLMSRLNAQESENRTLKSQSRVGLNLPIPYHIDGISKLNITDNNQYTDHTMFENGAIKKKLLKNIIKHFLCHTKYNKRQVSNGKGAICKRKSRDMSVTTYSIESNDVTSLESKIRKLRSQMFDVLLTIEQIKKSLEDNAQTNMRTKDPQEHLWEKLYESYLNRTRPSPERSLQLFKNNLIQKMSTYVNTFKKIIEFVNNNTIIEKNDLSNERNQRHTAEHPLLTTSSPAIFTTPEMIPKESANTMEEILKLKTLLKTINNINDSVMQQIIELVDSLNHKKKMDVAKRSDNMDTVMNDIISKLNYMKGHTERQKRSPLKYDNTAIDYLLTLLEVFLKDNEPVTEQTEDGLDEFVEGTKSAKPSKPSNFTLMTTQSMQSPSDTFASPEIVTEKSISLGNIEAKNNKYTKHVYSPSEPEVSFHQPSITIKEIASQEVDLSSSVEATTNSNDVRSHKIFFYSTSEHDPRIYYENGAIKNTELISHKNTEVTTSKNLISESEVTRFPISMIPYPEKIEKPLWYDNGGKYDITGPQLTTTTAKPTVEEIKFLNGKVTHEMDKNAKATMKSFNLFMDYNNFTGNESTPETDSNKNTSKAIFNHKTNLQNILFGNDVKDLHTDSTNKAELHIEKQEPVDSLHIKGNNSEIRINPGPDLFYSNKEKTRPIQSKQRSVDDPLQNWDKHHVETSKENYEPFPLYLQENEVANILRTPESEINNVSSAEEMQDFNDHMNENIKFSTILNKNTAEYSTQKNLDVTLEIKQIKEDVMIPEVSKKRKLTNSQSKNHYHFNLEGFLETPSEEPEASASVTNKILLHKQKILLDFLDYGTKKNEETGKMRSNGPTTSPKTIPRDTAEEDSTNEIENYSKMSKLLKNVGNDYLENLHEDAIKVYSSVASKSSAQDKDKYITVRVKSKSDGEFSNDDAPFDSEHFHDDPAAEEVPLYFE